MTSGTLYLIPNTLGQADLDEADPLSAIIPTEVQAITSRIDYFIAENAKSARVFLKLVSLRHALAKPLQQIDIADLNVNTPTTALPKLIEPLLAGRDAGLISEAGVPAVADPGSNLVDLAHRHGIVVRPLVGPSSLLLAVMASGLSGQSFAFSGYLPVEPPLRAKRVKELEERSRKENQTQLFIETPYRNLQMLNTLVETCNPATRICVATDLTLMSESVKTQTAAKWKSELKSGNAPEFNKRPTVFLLLGE